MRNLDGSPKIETRAVIQYPTGRWGVVGARCAEYVGQDGAPLDAAELARQLRLPSHLRTARLVTYATEAEARAALERLS